MYYINSEAKSTLENWYQVNIGSNSTLDNKVASDNYYCEQAKVAYNSSYASNSGANMMAYTSYIPDFKCVTDENNQGMINSNIGLPSYDEIIYAGGYYGQINSNYYLYNSNIYWWTMSSAGFTGVGSTLWFVNNTGSIDNYYGNGTNVTLRPVLNLKLNTKISEGNGTKDNPFVVE